MEYRNGGGDAPVSVLLMVKASDDGTCKTDTWYMACRGIMLLWTSGASNDCGWDDIWGRPEIPLCVVMSLNCIMREPSKDVVHLHILNRWTVVRPLMSHYIKWHSLTCNLKWQSSNLIWDSCNLVISVAIIYIMLPSNFF
jgi:hypothetical protein